MLSIKMGLAILFTRLVLAFLLWTTFGFILYQFPLGNYLPLSQKPNIKIPSECSENATKYGGVDQKVISFSLCEENGSILKEEYIRGIRENVAKIKEFYPGWLIRIYTDISEKSDYFLEYQNSESIFICDVRNLPTLGDVSGMNDGVWNFLPIGDPSVSIFIARDLTAVVSERESVAVAEWEKSNKVFHAMRDHPVEHFKQIPMGLWGAKTGLLDKSSKKYIQGEFLKWSLSVSIVWGSGAVEALLADIVYQRNKNLFMIHDSYHCQIYNDSVPFPQQRKNTSEFVGNNYFVSGSETGIDLVQCPPQCRPSYGKDWLYC